MSCIRIARASHLQSAIAGQRPSHRAAPAAARSCGMATLSTSWCECEPSTSSSSHRSATASDARGCSHPECRVLQRLLPASQSQHEHAEHQDECSASTSRGRAICNLLLLASARRIELHKQRTQSLGASCAPAAHNATAQLLSQAAGHDHVAWPL